MTHSSLGPWGIAAPGCGGRGATTAVGQGLVCIPDPIMFEMPES